MVGEVAYILATMRGGHPPYHSFVTSAALTCPLLLSFVLALSGAAKLRDPGSSTAAFDALKVPGPLSNRLVRHGQPWFEIILGVALLTLPGRWQLAAAVAVLALLLVYLWLVIRALASADPVDCACFGAIGSDRVTRWTVVRNAWLVLLAIIGLPVAMSDTSVLARLMGLGSEAWWLAAVAAGAFKSVEEACSATIRIVLEASPDRAAKRTYDAGFPVYQDLYRSLRDDFKAIAAL